MVAALRQVIDMGPTLGRDGRVVTRISVPSPELRKGLSASPYDGSMTDSLQQLRALVHEHELRAVVSDLDGVLRVFDPALWSELDAIAGSRTAPPSPPCSAILSSTRWCAAAARISSGGNGPPQRWSRRAAHRSRPLRRSAPGWHRPPASTAGSWRSWRRCAPRGSACSC